MYLYAYVYIHTYTNICVYTHTKVCIYTHYLSEIHKNLIFKNTHYCIEEFSISPSINAIASRQNQ